MMQRLGRFLSLMAKNGLDCVIVKDIPTIRYLSGFRGDSSLLYVDAKSTVLITDGRYTTQAEGEVQHYCRVFTYNGDIWQAAADFAKAHTKIGFDGAAYSYNDYQSLKEAVSGKELLNIDLKYLRMVKDERELNLMWKAFKIADQAFLKLLPEIKPGMTEKALAARLEYYMSSMGSEKTSFDTIIASGARSALPHGMASDKQIEIGDFITFDFGAVYDGYHSDMTRTVVLGMANSWHKEIYTIVEEAQWRGLKSAKPGMTGAELDAIVREYITTRGYGENYVHGLGHGVGLEIHEMPNINKRGTDVVLEPGMTFSIEPGIYIPGKGGVRIEDTVVLTDDGAKVLCGVKKQLMEIV